MKNVLQGNVCACGGVWFNVAMPESEPSFCPFCIKKISEDGIGEGEMGGLAPDNELPDGIKKGLPKASGHEDVKLVKKVCTFCTNDVFFDFKDAGKGNNCPYCAGDLVIAPREDSDMTQDDLLKQMVKESFMKITDINEMTDKIVQVTMKGIRLPFFKIKPQSYVFHGMDQLSMMVKLQSCDNGEVTWVSMNDVKLIKVLKFDEKSEKTEKG